MFNVNNKDTRTTPFSTYFIWTYFTPFSSVSIVNFEQANTSWDCKHLYRIHSIQVLAYNARNISPLLILIMLSVSTMHCIACIYNTLYTSRKCKMYIYISKNKKNHKKRKEKKKATLYTLEIFIHSKFLKTENLLWRLKFKTSVQDWVFLPDLKSTWNNLCM